MELRAQGFCKLENLVAFNGELLKPLKGVEAKDVCKVVCQSKDETGFLVAISLAFWLGVLGGVLELLPLFGGGLVPALVNIGLGYVIQYTLYFVFIVGKEASQMKYGVALLIAYLALNALSTLGSLVFVVPALLFGLKTVLTALALKSAFGLYKGTGATLSEPLL